MIVALGQDFKPYAKLFPLNVSKCFSKCVGTEVAF